MEEKDYSLAFYGDITRQLHDALELVVSFVKLPRERNKVRLSYCQNT